jgi:hypothetical protein
MAVGVILAYLVAFDVLGVAVSFIFDALPLEGVSTFLFYTVWLVAGVFCGLLAYNKAGSILLKVKEGDWSGDPGSGKTGLVIIFITAIVLANFIALFKVSAWKAGGASDPFVPDSIPLTYTFFITMLVSMIGGHFFLRPKPTQKN